ncbi:MAG: BON domain-containing protein [Verrucomicrobiota bacterium]|jgi:osmotically-inducible protein OsmY
MGTTEPGNQNHALTANGLPSIIERHKMKSNAELQRDVQDAIKWQPLLNAAEIGVTAKDGIVSLTGVVDNYAKKTEAEDAAKNVAGVTALVEKIEVKYPSSYSKTNAEIATEVLTALKASWDVPKDKVKVKVEAGWITLTGEVSWYYQKEAARDAILNLMGVTGVTNNIAIKSESMESVEKAGIENALKRNWAFYENDIKVQVSGHRATLTGTVDSLYQRDEAGSIAWNAPGVWSVDNELVVDWD